MAEILKTKRRIAIVTGAFFIMILAGVLLTNALPKQSSYYVGDYLLKVPSGWKVDSSKSPNFVFGNLEFKKENTKIGGVQIIGTDAENPTYLPNHSKTNSKKNIDGLLTKAILVNFYPQPESQNSFMQNENHLFLIFESEKTAYDIYGISKYVNESELIKIAKSFEKVFAEGYDAAMLLKLKTPYVGSATKVGAILTSLPFRGMAAKNGFSLKTCNQPHGITMSFDLGYNGLKPEQVEATFKKNATLMFALIDNVDEINFILTSSGGEQEHKYQYTRTQIQQSFYKDLRQYAKDLKEFDTLIKSISIEQTAIPKLMNESSQSQCSQNQNAR